MRVAGQRDLVTIGVLDGICVGLSLLQQMLPTRELYTI